MFLSFLFAIFLLLISPLVCVIVRICLFYPFQCPFYFLRYSLSVMTFDCTVPWKAINVWRVPTHCIPWRPATSTRSGSQRSGMVIKTVYETVRVFQTNNNNNNVSSIWLSRAVFMWGSYTTCIFCVACHQGSPYVSHPSSAYDLFLTSAASDCIKLWDLRSKRYWYWPHICLCMFSQIGCVDSFNVACSEDL